MPNLSLYFYFYNIIDSCFLYYTNCMYRICSKKILKIVSLVPLFPICNVIAMKIHVCGNITSEKASFIQKLNDCLSHMLFYTYNPQRTSFLISIFTWKVFFQMLLSHNTWLPKYFGFYLFILL